MTDYSMDVVLTRRPEDIPEHDLDKSNRAWLKVRCSDGEPTWVTQGYVDGLKANGWRGTEFIPAICIRPAPVVLPVGHVLVAESGAILGVLTADGRVRQSGGGRVP